MKSSMTELVFILDRSGSMAGLEADSIGGFNSMIEKQRELPGEARVTTVLFNHEYELFHDRTSLDGVAPLTEGSYEVGGTTAMLDAIGATIQKISNVQKATEEELRADKVLFIITTDGMENSSCEYSFQKVRDMVSSRKEKNGWEFLFLGANIDAATTAGKFGVKEEYAVNYHADGQGTELNFKVLNAAVASFRGGKSIDRNWKERIEKDYQERSK